jgi:hypothetical protein
MPMRDHDVSSLTAGELDHARRELAASLGLARPGSPIRATIEAQLRAIDAEQSERERLRLRLCGCGFATNDAEWMDGHLFEHPAHQERKAEQMSAAWIA